MERSRRIGRLESKTLAIEVDDPEGAGVWWLNLFLARTFFLPCGAHENFGNHQNQYCIDCEMAACQHCLAEETHADHRVLTIYRLVYKDVVSLDQMSRHIDCSRIQRGKEQLS
ncbi:hypothetical protein R6Q57_011605 [Mikania cordata]